VADRLAAHGARTDRFQAEARRLLDAHDLHVMGGEVPAAATNGPERARASRRCGVPGHRDAGALSREKRAGPERAYSAAERGAAVDVAGCPLPEDRLYDLEQDVWWAPSPDGATGTVGLLATLAAFAGPFSSVTFRPVTGVLARGRSVATIESVRFTGAVRLPVEADVVERNEALVGRPRLLNDAAYGDGWVVRVRPVRPDDPARLLETAPQVADRLRERILRQRIRCWPVTPDIELFEIGIECSAVLTMLNEELGRRPAGTAVRLVTDDPLSPIEMVRWSDQTGHALLAHRAEGNLHEFLVRKEADPRPRRRPEL
jgi:glycine cleavage system H protein